MGSYLFGGSGGGISSYESQPSYQNGVVTQSTTKRTSPDVAYNADPNTGFYVYDGGSWYAVGGTSAGAPQWAALIAIADQARVANNPNAAPLSTLETLSALYQTANSSSYTSDFRDITSGNNGYSAGSGYDLVTGLGSPKAPGVVATLQGASASMSLVSTASTTAPSTKTSAKLRAKTVVASVGADPTSASGLDSSSAFLASLALPATTAPGIPVLIQPSQTFAASGFGFDSATLSNLAAGPFQTSTALAGNSVSQTSAASVVLPGWQVYATGFNSDSTRSAARGSSLLTPFLSESADGVMPLGPGRADDLGLDALPVLQQALRVPGQGDVDLDLIPTVPDETQSEEKPGCDACFMDEVSMALVAEQTLALASADTEASPELHGCGLAFLGIFASSLWMTPDAADETRKRRESLLRGSR